MCIFMFSKIFLLATSIVSGMVDGEDVLSDNGEDPVEDEVVVLCSFQSTCYLFSFQFANDVPTIGILRKCAANQCN